MTQSSTQKDERVKNAGLLMRVLRRPEFGALLGAAAIFILFASTDTTGNFAAPGGIAGWTDIAAPIGIVGIAVALLMIAGEFDLSTGVMVGSVGLLTGLMITEIGLPVWPSIFLAMLFAAIVGFVNGYVVVKTKLPSFIVTLATFFVLKGANMAFTKMVTGAVRVTGLDKGEGFESAEAIFASKVGDFQISLFWWIGLTIVATFVLTRTRFGNWIYAAGGDANAARNAGVPVDFTKITLFVVTAMAAALVGVMFVLRLKGMQAGQGVGQEFYYIIAAAVGGTLLTGGAGSAVGASIGALIMGMAYIGIPYSRWDSDWTSTFLGIILFTAVMINTYISRKARGGKK
ncbi:ABC transporter permease [Candidatus Rhodoluna planktonica]|uniref:Xylose transport system permease protein XylH n=1 Tax=Candidatus Rhodoluna planktonica TaxID=535712 RepID=A0A1D9DXG7_9MICO|nr:ABC transporter permease [Candidatus Rhodoluna planktonica]AOY55496.1 ribose ABC transporter permease [Candidatus Rhodoluna planktonica]